MYDFSTYTLKGVKVKKLLTIRVIRMLESITCRSSNDSHKHFFSKVYVEKPNNYYKS